MATHDDRYKALRKKGMTKEQAATTAETLEPTRITKGERSRRYEERTKEQLEDKARHAGIEGRGDMKRHDLIAKLRRHGR